ncbi:ASCH domain-containing protein [Microbacterium gorillae]|uniref:ASCH domain-containing protein n=1 Tax=Microbacterium gorillae TaxID=1231063 RepID=UPI000590EA80|nr:ASCH domain-containing protein [Microbacterium gorillae]
MSAVADLPREEFAFPGPLRDTLVAAILSGAKTSTSSLVREYEHEGEPLPEPHRGVLIDSDGRPVAILRYSDAVVVRCGDVPLAHAITEGEGYTSVAEWRAGHESFWHSAEFRAELGDPDFRVTDDELVVLERFVLERVL